MNKILIGAATVVAAAALTACGSSSNNSANNTGASNSPSPSAAGSNSGGGGNANDAAAIAAIKNAILKDSAGTTGPLKMTDAQAQCTATSVVNALGPDKLRTYGYLTSDGKYTGASLIAGKLSTADATAVVNGIVGCIGESTFDNLVTTTVSSHLPSNLTAAQRACIKSHVSGATLKAVMIGELSANTAAVGTFVSSITSCMG